MEKPKLLAIGGQEALNLAEQGYPGFEITYQKDHKIKSRKKYDAIIAYHVLNRLKNDDVMPYLKRLRSILVNKGVLNLFVPSFEWAADQISIAENPSPVLWLHLFGHQNDKYNTNYSAYTLRRMRYELDEAGFAVTHATMGLYSFQIVGDDGKPVLLNAGENIVIAYRRKQHEALKE